MNRLKAMLESLDEAISDLEDKVAMVGTRQREEIRRHNELLKQSRTREASVLAVAQKVAARLDQTIQHVEKIAHH